MFFHSQQQIITFDNRTPRLIAAKLRKATTHSDCNFFRFKFEAVKMLVYILSLSLFFLSCFPCLEDDCREYGKDEVFSYTSNNEETPYKKPEACTPFCIDSCCSIHVICHAVHDVSLSRVEYQTTTSQYLKDTFSSFRFTSIWQPPKAS
jgi:hypothetical protein